MVKQNNKQFAHKKERSCNFFSTDHHGCITSQVRTFSSPFEPVWEEIDLSYFEQCPILEVPIDISLHDKGTDMRAYRHADSGVILLEMNLYDYENEIISATASYYLQIFGSPELLGSLTIYPY